MTSAFDVPTATGRFFVGSTPYVVVDGLTRSVVGGVEVAPCSIPGLLRTVRRQDLRRLLVRVLGGGAGSGQLDALATAVRLLEKQRLRMFRMPDSIVPVEPQTTHELVRGQGVAVANHWIEIVLEDDEGKKVPRARYRVVLHDKSERDGHLDENGFARLEHLPAGTCEVTFPDLDEDTWSRAGQPGASSK
jgi:hypothetical protein